MRPRSRRSCGRGAGEGEGADYVGSLVSVGGQHVGEEGEEGDERGKSRASHEVWASSPLLIRAAFGVGADGDGISGYLTWKLGILRWRQQRTAKGGRGSKRIGSGGVHLVQPHAWHARTGLVVEIWRARGG